MGPFLWELCPSGCEEGGSPGSAGSKPGWPCPAMLPQQDLYMLLWGRASRSWGPNLLQVIEG